MKKLLINFARTGNRDKVTGYFLIEKDKKITLLSFLFRLKRKVKVQHIFKRLHFIFH